jgi:hypothetical protein
VVVDFFDSSGLVKRYVNEIGTAWVNSIVDPALGNQFHLASITGVEVVSAITRQGRSGNLSAAATAAALTQFRREFATMFRIVDLSPALIAHAMTLAETHALRGYDAVQLAAALQVNAQSLALGLPFFLISADADLNAAALAEGLPVDDPSLHP